MLKKITTFCLSTILFLTILSPIQRQEIQAYVAQSSGYWVGMVSSSTNITMVDTVSSYADGISLMNKQTSTSTSVATLFKGSTIVASKYATLDFTVIGSSSVNSYMNAILSNGTVSARGYFNGYYQAEGPYITKGSSESDAVTVISGLKSKVSKVYSNRTQYEIVPISIAKPLNYYVKNDSGDLYHYFAYFSSQSSLRIGRAPDFMEANVKYYSYDGHYFYNDYIALIDDLNDNSTNRAINPDLPWYNYYQFLPFHSTTNYTASEIDSYLRSKGYTTLPYTYYDKKLNGQSKYPLSNESLLFSSGSYFMQMQQVYGINPLLLLSISINESSWGRSYISIVKNNLFGMAAYDSNTGAAAAYDSVLDSVLDVARVLTGGYFNAASDTNNYHGAYLGNKEGGVNVKYASDPYWGEKAAAHYYSLDKALGLKDYNTYVIGVTNKESVRAYTDTTSNKTAYIYNGVTRRLKNNSVIIIGEENNYYKVMSDYSLSKSNNWESNGFTTEYDFENNYVYVKKSDLTVVNAHEYVTPKNNEEINAIRIEYLHEYITLQVKNDSPLYYDAYQQTKNNISVKGNSYVVATERAYTSTNDYSYKIIYNEIGTTGWIKASEVKEISAQYAIKYNSTHDAIGSDVYSSTNTTNKLGSIKYNNQPIYIIDSKKVDKNTWYYTCLNASTGTYGWTLSTGYKAPVTHTVDVPDPDPDAPDIPITDKTYRNAGMYFLDSIILNDAKNAITIRGLLAIDGMDNKQETGLEFFLILTNQQDGSKIEIPMERWISDEYPFDASNVPGYKYDFSGAWFTQTFDFKDIPNGDYSLNIETRSLEYYTSKILSNDNSIAISQRFTNENNTGIELRTNFLLRTLPLELFVRHNGLLSTQDKVSLDNAFIEYTSLAMTDASLQIKGTAFNIKASYGSNEEINRTIIFENTTTFERFTFNIGSITNGDGTVTLRIDDGKDKTRAWFNANIDLSTLSRGTYAIYIHTISGDGVDDYGELCDSFIRDLQVSSSYNDMNYSLKLNKDKRYRIELIIE